jgi:two-component system sensor histidine kinase YesM
VADNGCGFDANQISEPLPRDRRQSGVGIRNVHERIRLSFGPRYGVMICTAPQEGTIVRIRIPDLEKGEQLDAPLPAGGMI